MSDILAELARTLEQRKQSSVDTSYVAKLYADGINKILQKVGEENAELIIASKDFAATGNTEDRSAVVYETADLIFHTLVMLHKLDISHEEVLEELARRVGVSGLDEKAARTPR